MMVVLFLFLIILISGGETAYNNLKCDPSSQNRCVLVKTNVTVSKLEDVVISPGSVSQDENVTVEMRSIEADYFTRIFHEFPNVNNISADDCEGFNVNKIHHENNTNLEILIIRGSKIGTIRKNATLQCT